MGNKGNYKKKLERHRHLIFYSKGIIMSRSYRKTSIIGNTGSSEKYDKVNAHRKSRKYIKDHIAATHGDLELLEEVMMPKEDEVSNPWTSSKDGKTYWDISEDDNDPDWLKAFKKKLMRK